MAGHPSQKWVSSKEIIAITGISRATLNNYIRLGLLPRPVLANPRAPAGGPKRLGYFPPSVLDRIEEIRQLKRSGKTIEAISAMLHEVPTERSALASFGEKSFSAHAEERRDEDSRSSRSAGGTDDGLRLTFDTERVPSYFIDSSLRVTWMNRAAGKGFFRQEMPGGTTRTGLNIFKLLFHWKMHESILNWKDLVRFHMSCAKRFMAREEIDFLYTGITRSEADLLREIWEGTAEFPETVFRVVRIPVLGREGLSESVLIHSLSFREGVLFVVGADAPCLD